MTLNAFRLNSALNIEDLRRLAYRRVPGFALAYLESGAEDHRTLTRNRDIFGRWHFVPDTLVDASERSLERNILGQAAKFPLIVAPTGFNGMLYHQADICLARLAARAGIPFTLSTMSTSSIEDVAAHAPGVRLWYQLYMLADRRVTRDLLRRATEAKAEALVFTTDCVHFGNRESERRHFRAPLKLSLPAMLNTACHPAWFFNVIVRNGGVPGFGNLARYFPPEEQISGRGARFVVEKLDFSINWKDLDFLRENWQGKLIVKGVLTPADALEARKRGADAIVLTNHGGRQLDGCVSPMEVLEEIRAATDSGLEILIDSGFRRGTDIAKALALGANAVMVGRSLLYGIAAAGQPGAEKALGILTSELDRTLAQLGVRDLAGLARRHIRERLPV